MSSSIQDSLSLLRKGSQRNNIARSCYSLKPFLFGSTSRIFIYARVRNVSALCDIFFGIWDLESLNLKMPVHVCGVTNLTLACQYLRVLVNLRPGETRPRSEESGGLRSSQAVDEWEQTRTKVCGEDVFNFKEIRSRARTRELGVVPPKCHGCQLAGILAALSCR